MANIWDEAISILAGNLNLGRSYLITTVFMDDPFHEKMSFAAAMLKVQHMPLLSSFK